MRRKKSQNARRGGYLIQPISMKLGRFVKLPTIMSFARFGIDPLLGLHFAEGRILPFPIGKLVLGPYNIVMHYGAAIDDSV